MRVLVTGIGGFVGPYVAAALGAGGHEVHGMVRTDASRRTLVARAPGCGALHVADVCVPAAVRAVVDAVRPDGVVHLAGVSPVALAEADPAAAYAVNVGGTLAVLAAVRASVPRARVVVVTSSHAYGAVERRELPLTEEVPFRPLTVYGASKAAADLAAAQWGRAYGLDVVCARPFNHTGPGQRADFVCSAVARQLAAIEAGRQEPVVQVGDPDPVRDFSDVRDIAAGHVALLERGQRGAAYNLCAERGTSVAEVIAILRTCARVAVRVHSDPARRRPYEVPRLVGSHARATRDTGWVPRIDLETTLADLLDDWRARLAAGGA